MSLTTQLHGGELGRWCAENFVSARHVAARVTAAVDGRRPVCPVGQVGVEHWAAIGGAFGQRLAWVVQPAPPYYALYGLVRAGIVSRSWADAMAARFPTHTGLGAEAAGRALELRPTPGRWADLGPAAGTGVRGEASGSMSQSTPNPEALPHSKIIRWPGWPPTTTPAAAGPADAAIGHDSYALTC